MRKPWIAILKQHGIFSKTNERGGGHEDNELHLARGILY